MTSVQIQYRPATGQEHELTVNQLKEHTRAAIGKNVQHVPFSLLAYAGDRFVGSIIGKSYLNWLNIDLTWVAEDMRNMGLGRELMRVSELKARELGLNGIEVWTQSWQAPGFYRKLGYEEFAVLDDFVPGTKRHGFRRHLTHEEARA